MLRAQRTIFHIILLNKSKIFSSIAGAAWSVFLVIGGPKRERHTSNLLTHATLLMAIFLSI